jgi:hypothetical protein
VIINKKNKERSLEVSPSGNPHIGKQLRRKKKKTNEEESRRCTLLLQWKGGNEGIICKAIKQKKTPPTARRGRNTHREREKKKTGK